MQKHRIFAVFTFVLAVGVIPVRAEPALGSANREPIGKFMAALSPPLAHARLVEANVPTVACAQDGQVGPLEPPVLPKSARVLVPEGTATSLALYSAYEGVAAGVLAPRGWDCFGTYGSSGTTLYVVPHPVGGPILDRFDKVKEGRRSSNGSRMATRRAAMSWQRSAPAYFRAPAISSRGFGRRAPTTIMRSLRGLRTGWIT